MLKTTVRQGMVAHVFNPGAQEAVQADFYKFEGSLVYTVSSKSVKAT